MKKKKTLKRVSVNVHIYGVFDVKKNKIIFISLNLEDVEMELALKDEDRYLRCGFEVTLYI